MDTGAQDSSPDNSQLQSSVTCRLKMLLNKEHLKAEVDAGASLFSKRWEEPRGVSQALSHSSSSTSIYSMRLVPQEEIRKHQSRNLPSHKILVFSPNIVSLGSQVGICGS